MDPPNNQNQQPDFFNLHIPDQNQNQQPDFVIPDQNQNPFFQPNQQIPIPDFQNPYFGNQNQIQNFQNPYFVPNQNQIQVFNPNQNQIAGYNPNPNQNQHQMLDLINLLNNNNPNDPNPNPGPLFLDLPNQNQNHYRKEVVQKEDGNWYVVAQYGPFASVRDAKFSRLHLPPDNLGGFRLILGHAGILYEKVLAAADLSRKYLFVTGPNVNIDMVPVGRPYRGWDPYRRRWWYFTTSSVLNVPVLEGWHEYTRAHHFRAGDKVQFRLAMNTQNEEFIVIQQERASPGATKYETPFENLP